MEEEASIDKMEVNKLEDSINNHTVDTNNQDNQEQNSSIEEQKGNRKMENNNDVESYTKSIPDNEKCNICGQFLNNSDIIYYQGHPQNAVEEYIALTNEKLVLASGQYLSSDMLLKNSKEMVG